MYDLERAEKAEGKLEAVNSEIDAWIRAEEGVLRLVERWKTEAIETGEPTTYIDSRLETHRQFLDVLKTLKKVAQG